MGFQKGHRPTGITGNPFTKDQESFIVNMRENQPERLDWQEMSKRFNIRFPLTPRSKGALQVHYSRSLQPSKRSQSRRDRRPDRASSSLTSSDYGGDDEDTASPPDYSSRQSRLPSSSPIERKSKKAKRESSVTQDNASSNQTILDVKQEQRLLPISTSKFETEAADILQNPRKRARRNMNYADPISISEVTSSDTLKNGPDATDTSTNNTTAQNLTNKRPTRSSKRTSPRRADDEGHHNPNMNEERKIRADNDESSSLSDAPASSSPFDSHLATAADQMALIEASSSTAASTHSPPIRATEIFSFDIKPQFRRSQGPSLSTRASLTPPDPRNLSRKSSSTEVEEQSQPQSTPLALPSSGNKRKFHSIGGSEPNTATAPSPSLSLVKSISTKPLPLINTSTSQDITQIRRSARPPRPARSRHDSLISPMTKIPIVEELQVPSIEEHQEVIIIKESQNLNANDPQQPAKPASRITLKLPGPTHRESAMRETQRTPVDLTDSNENNSQRPKKRKIDPAPWDWQIINPFTLPADPTMPAFFRNPPLDRVIERSSRGNPPSLRIRSLRKGELQPFFPRVSVGGA